MELEFQKPRFLCGPSSLPAWLRILCCPTAPSGQAGRTRESVLTAGQVTKAGSCAWTMAESLLYSVLRQLPCSYVDQVIQEFAFDVSDVFCPGFLMHPTLLHGQWVVCLFSGETNELIKWAHDDIGLLL